MTPLQWAKAECANYTQSGGCAGIGIHDDGTLFGFGSKPKCVLASGLRCIYFEECVLPMGIETNTAQGIIRDKHRNEARKLYRQSLPHALPEMSVHRICPVCNKRELEKGQRLCSDCKVERRREANRRKNEKRLPSTPEV